MLCLRWDWGQTSTELWGRGFGSRQRCDHRFDQFKLWNFSKNRLRFKNVIRVDRPTILAWPWPGFEPQHMMCLPWGQMVFSTWTSTKLWGRGFDSRQGCDIQFDRFKLCNFSKNRLSSRNAIRVNRSTILPLPLPGLEPQHMLCLQWDWVANFDQGMRARVRFPAEMRQSIPSF